MADRTVTVRLNAAVSGYIAQMQAAGRATAQVGTQGADVAKQAGLISPKLLSIGTAAAVVGGMAVSKMANFEAALSEVRAATGESAAGMDSLREAAIAAGGATKFSAEEAAQGITNLAKAGVSTADILDGGLSGALDLAAAGSMEVADAAEIASAALVTFKLEGSDMAHVADLLAAGAGKAMGEVSDLGYALKMAGTVAAQTGLSIEETTAALSAMASRGILGSDAGTSLKSFLQRLIPESKKAAEAMEQIGLEAYDAQGNFVGLEVVAGQLRDGLKDLTAEQQASALKTIFGSDAVRAAAVIYEEGADGVASWTDAVNDAGYASEYAATLTDNLKGDIERLTGALDTLFVEAAAGTNGPLRGLVQGLTAVVEEGGKVSKGEGWFGWLNKPLIPVGDQESLFGIGGGRSNTPPAETADVGGLPALSAQRYADALDDTARNAARAGSAVDKVADELLAAASASEEAAKAQEAANEAYLAAISISLRASNSAINYEASLDDLTETIEENGRNVDINTEKGRENATAVNNLRGAAADLIGTMVETGASQQEVADKAAEMADQVYDAARAAGYSKEEAREYADQLRDVPDEVKTEYQTEGAAAAEQAADEVANAAANAAGTYIIRFRTIGGQAIEDINALDGNRQLPSLRRHSGGEIPGYGDMPATLQGGEFVVNRRAYDANRDLVRAINSGGTIAGALGGGSPLVGQINVTAPKPDRAGANVIDALAEAAYRMGGVR